MSKLEVESLKETKLDIQHAKVDSDLKVKNSDKVECGESCESTLAEIEESYRLEEATMEKAFNEHLQAGYKSKKEDPALWDQCPPEKIKTKLVRESKPYQLSYEVINTEKLRYDAGHREVAPDLGRGLTGFEQIRLAGAREPHLIYPKKRMGFRDANGFNGYQGLAINYERY